MNGTPGYSADEIREIVYLYYLQPHGMKGAWIAQQPFSERQLRKWRSMLVAGDLDRNLVPRDHGPMNSGEFAAFERARAKEQADHKKEVERLKARIRELEGTNDALGKAIGLLHELSVQEPDTSKTNEVNSS
jgi:hypothetical protein